MNSLPNTRLPDTRRVLLRPDQWADPPPPFRCGTAGLVRLGCDGDFELEERVTISANSAHALIGHGVVDALSALGLEGTLGEGAPALFRPSQSEAARSILYEADRMTYGGDWEFVVAPAREEGEVEYCVAVVNREYQTTLVRLVDVFNRATRYGEGVWIAL